MDLEADHEHQFAGILTAQDDDALDLRIEFEAAQSLFTNCLQLEVSPGNLCRHLPYSVEVYGRPVKVTEKFIGGGDWSGWIRDSRKTRVMSEMTALIRAHLDFRQTNQYNNRVKGLATGTVLHFQRGHQDSIQKIERYFENFVRMILLAERFGIIARPISRANCLDEAFTEEDIQELWCELSESNVGVAVDANGSLLRVGPGKHRVAVADVLGLPSVPCEVRLIHSKYLRQFLVASGGNAVVATRHCIEHIRDQQTRQVEEKHQLAFADANDELRSIIRDCDASTRFEFSRSRLPVRLGCKLLCQAATQAIRRKLIITDPPLDGRSFPFFIGRGNWEPMICPLSSSGSVHSTMNDDRDTGMFVNWEESADRVGTALVLREDPIQLVISAAGDLLLLDDSGARLDHARSQGIGAVFAEIRIIHLDWLRQAIVQYGCSPLEAIETALLKLQGIRIWNCLAFWLFFAIDI